jgi:hypothetical protein
MSEITHESLMGDLESLGRSIDALRNERDKLKAELKEAHIGCIRLQQEINMLRMPEPRNES